MRSLKGMVSLILLAMAVVASVVFIQSNPEPVQLEFWRWRTKSMSLGWAFFITFFAGLFVALMAALSALLFKNAELSRYRRELTSLQKLLASKDPTQSHQK